MGCGGRKLIVCCCADGEMDTALLLLLWGVAWLVARSLIELREGVAEAVAEVGGAAVLLLEDGVLDDGSPYRAVLLVAGLEGAVLLLGEGTALLGPGLFKDGAAVWEGGADLAGEMRLCVGIVLLVRVGKVGAEPGGDERRSAEGRATHRSLRSTGERLSNLSFGSLRMAFQLPTPHCRG